MLCYTQPTTCRAMKSLQFNQFVCVVIAALLSIEVSTAQTGSPFSVGFNTADAVITGVALGNLFMLKKKRVFEKNELDSVNKSIIPAFERHVANNLSLKAKTISDNLLIGSMLGYVPVTFGYSDFSRTSTLGLQTVLFTNGLNTLAKKFIHRKRPFLFNRSVGNNGDYACKKYNKYNQDAATSFYSGHTAHVAAYSFFSATLYSHYNPGANSNRTLYWVFAGTLPAVVGHLRVRAGKHFPTDVITGYVIGGLTGLLIPVVHRSDNFKDSPENTNFGRDVAVGFGSGLVTTALLSILSKPRACDCQQKQTSFKTSLQPMVGGVNGLSLRVSFN